MARTLEYFLGANSARGFYSLYDGFTRSEEGDFLYVIKGGPGCGKSSFMRKIAQAATSAGLDAEYALCSGDPDSVDGVYLPALRTAYVDGTAPHVVEAALVGADSVYLDLSRFYDVSALKPRASELKALHAENKACYARAYASLRRAGELRRRHSRSMKDDAQIDRCILFCRATAGSEFHRTGGAGVLTRRFLTALSCQGHIALTDTVKTLCHEIVTLDNAGFSADLALEALAAAALDAGYGVTVCPLPLDPAVIEAVLIPELSLAFVASDSPLSNIEGARPVSFGGGAPARDDGRFSVLIEEALAALRSAKEAHDALEALYNPHVDFEGVYGEAKRHIALLGLSG